MSSAETQRSPGRVIQGAELDARKAREPEWSQSRFLVEGVNALGQPYTAGNFRLTRGLPDGTTETVRYLEGNSLTDLYADNYRGSGLLEQGDGEHPPIPVSVYQLHFRGTEEERQAAYDRFTTTALADRYQVRRVEIDLPKPVEGDDRPSSHVTFFLEDPNDEAGSDSLPAADPTR